MNFQRKQKNSKCFLDGFLKQGLRKKNIILLPRINATRWHLSKSYLMKSRGSLAVPYFIIGGVCPFNLSLEPVAKAGGQVLSKAFGSVITYSQARRKRQEEWKNSQEWCSKYKLDTNRKNEEELLRCGAETTRTFTVCYKCLKCHMMEFQILWREQAEQVH